MGLTVTQREARLAYLSFLPSVITTCVSFYTFLSVFMTKLYCLVRFGIQIAFCI